MRVRVRLFATLREQARRGSLELELAEGSTVAEALGAVADEASLQEVLARMPFATAVNREYAGRQTRLADGDELALIPPVSGGGGVSVRLGSEPLAMGAVASSVADPRAGATVVFQGTTRDVPELDYEAYVEMAEARIRTVLEECLERHGALRAAAEHRLGAVPLGEASVVVAVSAAHREEAFAAAREAIDRIKEEAPIWKRELTARGGRWVDGKTPAVPEPTPEEAKRR